jgi:uncharacterized membrane protein
MQNSDTRLSKLVKKWKTFDCKRWRRASWHDTQKAVMPAQSENHKLIHLLFGVVVWAISIFIWERVTPGVYFRGDTLPPAEFYVVRTVYYGVSFFVVFVGSFVMLMLILYIYKLVANFLRRVDD